MISAGHDLPNRHVIHCLGRVYGREEPAEELPASCYREALRRAEENDTSSVAFPGMSTGAFRCLMEQAAGISIRTVLGALPEFNSVEHICFVLFSDRARRIHESVLEQLTG